MKRWEHAKEAEDILELAGRLEDNNADDAGMPQVDINVIGLYLRGLVHAVLATTPWPPEEL